MKWPKKGLKPRQSDSRGLYNDQRRVSAANFCLALSGLHTGHETTLPPSRTCAKTFQNKGDAQNVKHSDVKSFHPPTIYPPNRRPPKKIHEHFPIPNKNRSSLSWNLQQCLVNQYIHLLQSLQEIVPGD